MVNNQPALCHDRIKSYHRRVLLSRSVPAVREKYLLLGMTATDLRGLSTNPAFRTRLFYRHRAGDTTLARKMHLPGAIHR